METEFADYSSFSMESIQNSLHEMCDRIQKETGATDEEMQSAFAVSANKVIDTSCLALT